ncbi:MAG: PKD domain-containing protein, partial [Bacteroidota bacterium]
EKIKAHSFTVNFLGSKARPDLEAEQGITTYQNFFLGNDPTKWASDVLGFQRLTYTDLYNGIDLRLQLSDKPLQFKYEFEVAPQVDPNQIQMQYDYAEKLWIDKSGNLHIKTSVNEVTEQKPYSYQVIDGQKVEIKSSFVLKENVVTFKLGKYDPNYPLVIDPVLIFATFSGSLADNWGSTAAADSEGNLYAGGVTFGSAFPNTDGSFDVPFAGAVDVAILKYNTTGTDLLYSTVFGGAFRDIPHSMIVDNDGNLLIMGATESETFPIRGAAYDGRFNLDETSVTGTPSIYNGLYTSATDIFIAKLNLLGNLMVSTFFGGVQNDGIMTSNDILVRNYGDEHRGEIFVDERNEIYIASVTNSPDFPFTSGMTGNDTYNGVLAKFSSNLSRLRWAFPIGGPDGDDALYSVKVASNGNIYACGGTTSRIFRTHARALNPVLQGQTDGFVVRYSEDGVFLGGTYLGASSIDQAYILDHDSQSNVYIFGQTYGGEYPVSPGVYQNPESGQFIHSLDPTLSETRFSTVFGKSDRDPDISPTAFMVNDCGNMFLAGWGGDLVAIGGGYFLRLNTEGLPLTNNALRSRTNGDDFYLMVLENNAQRLLFGSYFGSFRSSRTSDHVDGGTSRFDKETATMYHSVCACNGDDFPVTSGAFSEVNNSSNCSNAAFKLAFDEFEVDFDPQNLAGITTVEGCAPLELNFENLSTGDSPAYGWVVFEPTNTGADTLLTSEEVSPNYTFEEPGIYSVQLSVYDRILCQEKVVEKQIRVFGNNVLADGDTVVCESSPVQLSVTGANSYVWSPASTLDNPTSPNPTANPTQTTTYTVQAIGDGGCEYERQVTVEVVPDVNPLFEFELTEGCGNPIQVNFTNTTAENIDVFAWDFGNGQTSDDRDPGTVTYTENGNYNVTLTASRGGCEGDTLAVIPIEIRNVGFFDSLAVTPDPTICFGESAQIAVFSLGDTFAWTPAESLNDPTVASPVASPQVTTTYDVTITVADNPACILETEVTVNVIPEVTADFDIELDGLCGDLPEISFVNTSVNANDYIWDLGNSVTFDGETPSSFVYSQAGTYTIRLISRNQQCPDTITQEVRIQRGTTDYYETLRMPDDQIICAGDAVVLEVRGDADIFEWTPAESLDDPTSNAPTATPVTTTTYNVMIGNTLHIGCEVDSLVTITVETPIDPDFSFETSDKCGESAFANFINLTNANPDRFVWVIEGDSIVVEQLGEYAFEQAGEYEVTLIAQQATGACPNSVTKEIRADNVNPANVITPNSDGKNDSFVIDTSREGWQLVIYTRWGKEIYRNDSYRNEWTGEGTAGSYYYQLTSPEGESCKGWLHVLVE